MSEPKFTIDDAQKAADTWGLNCGPAAVAAILGLTLDELRPHLGTFERKGYTNPTLMFDILRNLKAPIVDAGMVGPSTSRLRQLSWPFYGLARVQWEGPWTEPGVPIRARYRHTHWVGSRLRNNEERDIFDVNCMCVGGWVPIKEWAQEVVPWLLNECEPKANGKWHLTHVIEIDPTVVGWTCPIMMEPLK